MGDKKLTLGTGHRKHVSQRPNTSHTSPRRVKLWRRRAQALDLREQNLSYREISRRMGCKSPTVAHQLVIGALQEMMPLEQKQNVRQMELGRLEKLMQTYFPKARKGDADAAKVYLKLAAEHSKLAGLYPDPHGSGGVNVNIGNETPSDASRFGINIVFREPQLDPKTGEVIPLPTAPRQVIHEPDPLNGRWKP